MKIHYPARSKRMIPWALALWSVLLLSSCAGSKIDKPEGKPLSSDEITKLIVGNTVNGAIGAQSFSFYYKSRVSVSGVIGVQGDDDSGTWEIEDHNTYCNEWDSFFDGVRRCYQWYKTERGYILENVDAYHLRPIVVYDIKPGNPLGF
jgi:hypothetical protein